MIVGFGFVLTVLAANGLVHLQMWRFWKDPNGAHEGLLWLVIWLGLGAAGALCGWVAFQGGFYLLLLFQGAVIGWIVLEWCKSARSGRD